MMKMMTTTSHSHHCRRAPSEHHPLPTPTHTLTGLISPLTPSQHELLLRPGPSFPKLRQATPSGHSHPIHMIQRHRENSVTGPRLRSWVPEPPSAQRLASWETGRGLWRRSRTLSLKVLQSLEERALFRPYQRLMQSIMADLDIPR